MRRMQWRSLIWLVKPFLLINRSKSKKISMSMDVIFLPDTKRIGEEHGMPPQPTAATHWSGLGLLAGITNLLTVLVILCLAFQKPFLCCIMSLKLLEMFSIFEYSCDLSFLYLKLWDYLATKE